MCLCSQRIPYCINILAQCDVPTIANGTVRAIDDNIAPGNTRFYASVEVICNPGFLISGNTLNLLTCDGQTGQIMQELPECLSELIDCVDYVNMKKRWSVSALSNIPGRGCNFLIMATYFLITRNALWQLIFLDHKRCQRPTQKPFTAHPVHVLKRLLYRYVEPVKASMKSLGHP